MKRKHANRAIFVLESPWELDDGDANRSSVLPFVEGIAKLAGDMEVFHANFYDKSSFKKAFECLCKTKYSNATVYIAAHGNEHKAGGVDLLEMLAEIGAQSKACNITGVLLGSCYVGKESSRLEAGIEDSNIRWCAAYGSSAEWLTGTLIDCAILSGMGALDEDAYADAARLIASFGESMAPFSRAYPIGMDKRNRPVALQHSMQFVIQPFGQGNKAKNVSEKVFSTWTGHALDFVSTSVTAPGRPRL